MGVVIKTTYPIMFDSTEVYYPSSFEVVPQTVEKVNQTEAGTDQVQLVRTGKCDFNFATKCLSSHLVTFETFSTKASFTFKYYDPALSGYATKVVRMRNFKYNVIKNSYDLDGVDGVYDVSFTLKEF